MWGNSESRVTIPLGRRRNAPVRVGHDVQEFCELVHILTATLCSEHVLGEMKDVLPLPIVGIKESLNMAPRSRDRVRVSPSALIDETDRVVHSVVCVSVSTQIAVRSPAVNDDHSAGFDPVTNDSHQRVGGSVRNGNFLPDSRSTPPNTHCHLTACSLLYFRRPNLLSSILTVLLGPPIF